MKVKPFLYSLLLIGWAAQSAPQAVEATADFDEKFLHSVPELSWGQDPFEKTPGYAQKLNPETEPHLEAVFFDAHEPTAVIDGAEYGVGEYVEARRVAEVGKNYVLLEKGDSMIELVLPPSPEVIRTIDIHDHRGRTR